MSVGCYGSPGPVEDSETLHSVIIEPVDLDRSKDAVVYTFLTHAERMGMSVLRGAASNDEFQITICLRLKNDSDRKFYGIVSFACSDVRALGAQSDDAGREEGDQLYYVLDTDIMNRPHHADVFATLPRQDAKVTNKSVWRAARGHLMAAVGQKIELPTNFRGGVLADSIAK